MLLFGVLRRQHFELSPVWCEYHEPSEMENINVPKEWIYTNLFERIRLSDDRAYYASSEITDYSNRSFFTVFCELEINEHNFQGYLYLVQGKINSISIFLGKKVVDIYSSDLLSEDNLETINELEKGFNIDLKGISSINYFTINDCPVVLEGSFNFSTE